MSSTGLSTSVTTLESIASEVSNIVGMLAPVASIAFPVAAPALAIAQKIFQGFMQAEPTAVALYDQIKSGTPVTPDQLQAFSASYESAYQKLNADINAKLAASV